MKHAGRLHLVDYYLLEAVNAMASTLFLYCYFFYTKARFGFSDTENLMLGAAQGLTYVFFARYGGRFAEKAGYETVIRIGIAGLAASVLLGGLPTWRGTPYVLVLVYMSFIAPVWPSLEAAILHAPSSMSMPARLGIYNIVWSLSGAAGFFLSGFLFRWRPDSILWVPGLMHLGQLAWFALRRNSAPAVQPSAMEIPHRGDDVPQPVKQRFLHTAWLANGISYFLGGGFTAIIPHLGERLGLEPAQTIWLTCTQLFARSLAFIIFWRWEGWHYRMPWSHAALWTAPAALTIVFFSHNTALVFCALAINGIAFGLTYYTSIYYSLDYGENKGEHGGLHEAILGVGILTGPLAGAIGSVAGAGTEGAKWTIIGTALAATVVGVKMVRSGPRRA